MSTFGAIDDVERAVRGVSDALAWRSKAAKIDREFIEPARQALPEGVADMRQERRLTMGELNERDADEIMDRLNRHSFDNRGPVTRFLDMIDVPRNFIAGTLASGIRKAKEEAGETATFGRGRVMFSDILGEMGVRPGIVRGVLGFIGDVVIDPLTYAFGSGVAARLATKSGRVIGIGRQGTRQIRGAVKAVAKGKEIRSPEIATFAKIELPRRAAQRASRVERLEKLAATSTPEEAAELTAQAGRLKETMTPAAQSEYLSRKVIGRVVEPIRDILIEGVGFSRKGAGSVVARSVMPGLSGYASAVDRARGVAAGTKTGLAGMIAKARQSRLEAARGVAARYGYGAPVGLAEGGKALSGGFRMTAKGPAFGDAQSQLAHLPFTELGVWGPAMTASGKSARSARLLALVKDGNINEAVRATAGAGHALAAAKDYQEVQRLTDDLARNRNLRDEYLEYGLEEQIPNLDATLESLHAQRREIVKGLYDRTKAFHDELPRMPEGAVSLATLRDLDSYNRAAKALAEASDARMRMEPFYDSFKDQRTTKTPAPFHPGGLAKSQEELRKSLDTVTEAELLKDPEALALTQRIRDIDDQRDLIGPPAPGTQPPEDFEKLNAQFRLDQLRTNTRERLIAQRADAMIDGILELPDERLDDIAVHADANYQLYKAAHDFREATNGSLLAVTTDKDRVLADVAKKLLEVDAQALDGSIFTSIRQALAPDAADDHSGSGLVRRALDGLQRRAFDTMEAAGRGGRHLWGNRGAEIDNVRRLAERTVKGGDRDMAARVLQPVRQALKETIRKFEIKPGQIDQFNKLVMLRIYAKVLAQGDERFFLDRIVNGKLAGPGKMKALMEEAKSVGWFDKNWEQGKYAGLMDRADQIADQWIALDRRIGKVGKETRTLGKLLPGHVPLVMDPAAAARIMRDATAGAGRQAKKVATAAAEGLQRSRSTMKYVWVDEKGVWRELADPHFALAKLYSPEALDALRNSDLVRDTKLAKRVEEIQADVAAFNKQFTIKGADGKDMPLPEGVRRALMGYNLDPFEAQELTKAGVFDALFARPADDIDGVFTTNALHMMSEYVASHFAAQAKASAERLLNRHALPLTTRVHEVARADQGTDLLFDNGVTGRVLDKKSGRVLIGDTVWRKPEGDGIQRLHDNTLFSDVLDSRNISQYLPEQEAETLERFIAAGDPLQFHAILEYAAKMQEYWKAFTLAHPSWTVWNLVSMPFLALQGRIPLAAMARYGRDGMRLSLGGTSEKVLSREIVANGQRTTLRDISDQYLFHGSGATHAGDWIRFFPEANLNTYSRDITGETRLARVMGVPRDWVVKANRQLGAEIIDRAPNGAEKIAAIGKVIFNESYLRRAFHWWAQANAKLEDGIRLSAFMALLDAGESAASAGARVRSSFYDFGDMTRAEQTLRKYVFPWFAWTRNNAGYQILKALEDPKWIGMVPKLKEALEEAVAGEQQVPEYMRPTYLREQIAIQLGADPSARSAITVGTVAPTEPVNVLGGMATGLEGVQGGIGWLASQLTPALSIPIQVGAKRETFTGRTIGPSEGRGDLSMSEFLLGQLRPVRELVPIGPRTPPIIRAAEGGYGTLGARVFLGGRAQPFEAERIQSGLERDLRERENELRKYITLAERERDEERSLEGRAMLMALYEDAMKRGLKIPVWARKLLRPSEPAAP